MINIALIVGVEDFYLPYFTQYFWCNFNSETAPRYFVDRIFQYTTCGYKITGQFTTEVRQRRRLKGKAFFFQNAVPQVAQDKSA